MIQAGDPIPPRPVSPATDLEPERAPPPRRLDDEAEGTFAVPPPPPPFPRIFPGL